MLTFYFFHIKVFFFCEKEPFDGCGGETPLVKNSELIARLNPEVVRKLEEKQIRYVRYLPNEAPGVHLSWQRSFVTNDRKVSLIYIPSIAVSYVMYKNSGLLDTWHYTKWLLHRLFMGYEAQRVPPFSRVSACGWKRGRCPSDVSHY